MGKFRQFGDPGSEKDGVGAGFQERMPGPDVLNRGLRVVARRDLREAVLRLEEALGIVRIPVLVVGIIDASDQDLEGLAGELPQPFDIDLDPLRVLLIAYRICGEQ